MSITALNAVLTADTAGFTAGMGKARTSLGSMRDMAAQTFAAAQTPMERYETRLAQLNAMLKQGWITQETYARAVQQTNSALATMQRGTAAGKVFDATRTPLEKYQAKLKELRGLLQTGQINQDTFGRAVKQSGQEYRASALSAAGLGGRLAALANPITAALAALTALTAATIKAGAAGIKLAAEYEQTQVAFATMLGSASKADAVLGQISQFAARTPFEFPELADAAKKLAAFGVSADQLVPSLRVIGDVSSGIGQPLGEIAEIYGKVRTQGRLYGDDIRQLGGRGIPIVAELAKQFGVTEGQVSKLVEQGKVGFDNLQRAFASMTDEGGRFHGMTEAQSQTLMGLSSTLKDNVNLALRDFGIALTQDLDLKEHVKGLIKLTSVLSEAAPAYAHMAAKVLELGAAFAKFATIYGPISTLLNSSDESEDERGIALDARIAEMNQKLEAQGLQRGEKTGLRIDERGPDMAAQEKALKDFLSFSTQLDEQFNSIGLSSAQAKLQEFFRLAQTGKIKLDTADLDAARQKLAQLEHAETLQGIQELEAELQKQIAIFGQTGNAAKFYELALKGATDAELAGVRALDSHYQAMQRQKAFMDDMQKRLAVLGKGADEAKFYDMAQKGAGADEIAQARRINGHVKSQEALQKVADEMQKVRDGSKLLTADMAAPFQALFQHLQDLGKQLDAGLITQKEFDEAAQRGMEGAHRALAIMDETRSPLQKFQADLNELAQLYAQGFIDEATFDRAAGKRVNELDKEGHKNPAALERGSAEAYSAILRASQQGGPDSTAARSLTEQTKMRIELEKANRLLAQRGPQVQIRDLTR